MGTKTYINLNKFSFADLTTFKTGGNIKHYFEVSSQGELVEKISFTKSNHLPIFIIGGGSDILVSDDDFNGAVVKYVADKITFFGETITAEAGVIWDKLVEYAVSRNLQGIECLSAIPGTVGAAPIQNIGAYGQELKDTFLNLTAFDIDNEKFVTFSNKECKFGYRDSIFKDKKYWQKYLIVDITLKLNKNKKPQVFYESIRKYLKVNPTLQEVRKAVITQRSKILEDWEEMPNAGSYFKNPIVSNIKLNKLLSEFPGLKHYDNKISAGWLIEQAGWKGKSLGGAKVSDLHALIITNPNGKGKTKDVLKLAQRIKSEVNKKFGIKLEPEVQYIEF